MLRESQQIALKVLLKLDELGWSQKDLAKTMEVAPQQITKIVSGKENLTIETQIKLQNVLDIPVLASYYENKMGKTSFCNSGESCWCRIIEPEEKMVDDSGNEIYIAGSGQIPKIYAEHIVKIHNKNLKNDNRGNKIKNKGNTKNDGL